MDYGLDYEGDMSGMGGGGYGGGAPTPGGGGGGGNNPQGSSGTRKRASYDEQTVRAVTVHMMMQCQPQQMHDSTALQLPDSRPLYHVSFVAAVRTFEDNSTHVLYQMEDGTGGVIGVKQWLDDSTECSGVAEMRRLCSREHVYLKVVGQLKDYDGTKMVLADSIRPLMTANQLTHHFLQVIYQAEQYKKTSKDEGSRFAAGGRFPQPNFAGAAPVNSGTALSNQHTENQPLRKAVINAFAQSDMGSNINDVVQSLRSEYPEDAIRNEITYLSSEGKLYSTIDEDHLGVA